MKAHISSGEGMVSSTTLNMNLTSSNTSSVHCSTLTSIDLTTSQASNTSCSNTVTNDIMQSNTSRRQEVHRLDVPPEHVLRFPEAEAAHER